jgi:exonuclease SbcC
MRLHTLTFRGMGPFAAEQRIDFAALGEAGMFLLEGPTGVGKSTIIDAIVFALYGSVAGSEADSSRLVSHFRSPAEEPFVEMTFSTALGTYRVRRSPSHFRPRTRGTGDPVEQKATAGLARLSGPADPAGEALAAGPQDVAAEIYRAVGLSREQFVRTIVLPQGEFATFLRASSKERLPLLQRIFRTHLYQDLQQRLKDAGKRARSIREAATAGVSAAQARFRGAVGAEALSDVDGASPADGVRAALQREVAVLDEAARRSRDTAAAAAKAAEQAKAALASADRRVELRDTLAEARSRRDALQTELPQVEAHRAALAADERAGRVIDALAQARSAERTHESAAAALASARGSAPPDLADEPVAPLRAARLDLRTLIGQLQPFLAEEAAIPGKQEQLHDLQQRQRAAHQQCEDLQRRLTEVPTERAAAEAALHSLQQRAAELPALQQNTAALHRRAAAAGALPAVLEQLESLRKQAEQQVSVLDQAVAAEADCTARYRLGIAATLGMALQPGEPCPACGSAEHPDPATAGADHATSEDVDRAAAHTAAARSALDEANNRLRAQEDRATDLRHQADGLTAQDAPAAVAAAAAAVAAAEDAADRVDSAGQRVAALAEESEQAAEALRESLDRRAGLSAQSDGLAAELARLASSLADARDGHRTVQDRAAAIQQRDGWMEQLIEAHQQHDAADRARRTAEAALASALERESFADAAEADRARLPDTERQAAQELVQAHREETLAVNTTLQRPELQGVDADEVIDRQPLQQAEEDADRARQDAATASAEASQTARLAAEHAEAVEAAVAERDAVLARTETDILLARVAEGNNALRIDLATFVLVHRFRSVIGAANHHLMRMSNGRLLLEAYEEAERRNERAGLGIRVRDLHTESVRSAKSLSGGETFYASLSLALGLAEIVTAESGGVELDTLFVDEGFGSLDPDTLDSVMAVLDGLQRNGRVLGLVSHVTEMKERIAERVEVRRVAQTGASTLRVVA